VKVFAFRVGEPELLDVLGVSVSVIFGFVFLVGR
jgi:hypothetical protein